MPKMAPNTTLKVLPLRPNPGFGDNLGGVNRPVLPAARHGLPHRMHRNAGVTGLFPQQFTHVDLAPFEAGLVAQPPGLGFPFIGRIPSPSPFAPGRLLRPLNIIYLAPYGIYLTGGYDPALPTGLRGVMWHLIEERAAELDAKQIVVAMSSRNDAVIAAPHAAILDYSTGTEVSYVVPADAYGGNIVALSGDTYFADPDPDPDRILAAQAATAVAADAAIGRVRRVFLWGNGYKVLDDGSFAVDTGLGQKYRAGAEYAAGLVGGDVHFTRDLVPLQATDADYDAAALELADVLLSYF